MTFLDFFKSKKGRDKEFQKFWKTLVNKNKKTFELSLSKVEKAILEE